MRLNSSLLLSVLTLIFCSENWLCLGKTTACGNTMPFNASISVSNVSPDWEQRLFVGCVTDKNIVDLITKSSIEVYEEDTFVDLPLLRRLFSYKRGTRELKPGFIKKVTNLSVIHLKSNEIETIQTGVFSGRFGKISQLDLSKNRINAIEKAAFSNFSANSLQLDKNQLSLVGDWFENTIIEKLKLSSNLITFLKKNAFVKIQNLQSVWLDRNRIQFIELDTFTNQRSIYLEHNFLYNINFLGDITLSYLDISSNKISSLQLAERTQIENINIYPNPWNCNCLQKFWKLAWERSTYYHPSSKNTTVPICISRNECNEQYIDLQLQEEYFKTVIMYT